MSFSPPWEFQAPIFSLRDPDPFLLLGDPSSYQLAEALTLTRLPIQKLVWDPNSWVFNKLPDHSDLQLGLRTTARFENYKYCLTHTTTYVWQNWGPKTQFHEQRFCSLKRGFPENPLLGMLQSTGSQSRTQLSVWTATFLKTITPMHFVTVSKSSPLKPQKWLDPVYNLFLRCY